MKTAASKLAGLKRPQGGAYGVGVVKDTLATVLVSFAGRNPSWDAVDSRLRGMTASGGDQMTPLP
jgi:hypothetical protein